MRRAAVQAFYLCSRYINEWASLMTKVVIYSEFSLIMLLPVSVNPPGCSWCRNSDFVQSAVKTMSLHGRPTRYTFFFFYIRHKSMHKVHDRTQRKSSHVTFQVGSRTSGRRTEQRPPGGRGVVGGHVVSAVHDHPPGGNGLGGGLLAACRHVCSL